MNRKLKYFLPILHIIASFFYERLILDFSLDYSVVLSIAKGGVSDRFEMVLTYTISKIIACIFIIYLWKLFFYIVEKGYRVKCIRSFIVFYLVGLFIYMVCWPETFLHSQDNLITYAYAVKLAPEYWHSMYSGCIYTASMMVAPFAIMINVLQWTGFVCGLGYLYLRLSESTVITGKKKILIFVLMLIPDTYLLVGDAYRTEQYSVLLIFYMSLIVMDIIDKRIRPSKEIICLAVLSAFIAVWRSEGLVLGILGFIALIIFVYKLPVKKIFVYSALVIVCYVLISKPQKLGDTKYYGKDYSFINSFSTLHNILCAESANLSYEGAEDDLAAIEAVVPLEMVRAYGMDGYRRFNYSEGRPDINQSLATDEESSAYMSAYYSLILHNPKIYIKNQIVFLMQAMKLKDYPYVENYNGTIENDLPAWKLTSWDTGFELYSMQCENYYSNETRLAVYSVFKTIYDSYAGLFNKFYIFTALALCMVGFETYIFFKDLIFFIKKKTDNLGFAVFALILLGQAALIFLVMPAGVTAYFHGYMYCTLILEVVYIIYNLSNKKHGEVL